MTMVLSFSVDDEVAQILSGIKGKQRSKFIREKIKANVNILPSRKEVVLGLQKGDIELDDLLEHTLALKNICEANVG